MAPLEEIRRLRSFGYSIEEITNHLWGMGIDVYPSEVWEACEGIDVILDLEEWI